ncbi:GNAT family N-acetyltransferase [Marinobacteraceae bacterium S3BR75-40.1]
MDSPKLSIPITACGKTVTLRTITPADREIEAAFVRKLSAESRYLRFHGTVGELTPRMLDYFTRLNFPESFALIATVSVEGQTEEIAVARYAQYPNSDGAEVAIVVADEWQNCGIGTRMLTEVGNVAREAGIRKLYMNVLPNNRRMLQLAQELGFEPAVTPDHEMTSRGLGKPIQS